MSTDTTILGKQVQKEIEEISNALVQISTDPSHKSKENPYKHSFKLLQPKIYDGFIKEEQPPQKNFVRQKINKRFTKGQKRWFSPEAQV